MRNPLSTALWSAELLARLSPDERAGARGEKLAGMCLRSLQRLRLLIEDHFLADRLAVSGMPLRFESVPLLDALESVLPKSGVQDAIFDIPSGLVALVDRGLLDRALEGLLAVTGKGNVPVRVTAAAKEESVFVKFEGAPPPPEGLQLPQKGTASDPTGRALSLHMAMYVARGLGGELSLEGEGYVLVLRAPPASGAAEAP